MLKKTAESSLAFPHPTPPQPGEPVEVAPGILWFRLPLPFRLDHVNIYMIEEGAGRWTVFDTGLGDQRSRDIWEAILAGPLAGQAFTRVIASHFHPDHVGLAGWLTERFGLPLYMSQTDYLMSLNLHLNPGALDAAPYREFYLQHGLNPETTRLVVTDGHNYLKMLTGLPPTFRRLIAGDTLQLGRREFEVLSGGGHAPEQIMLYCRAERLFLSADQVLAKISPNVSVWAVDPEGDPLALYLRSLTALKADLPSDALVLPGHGVPFYGLHARIDELLGHHERRCAAIAEACRGGAKTAAEFVPALFHQALGPHEMGFAFSEVLAHVNFMLRQNRLACTVDGTGVKRFSVTKGR